MPIRSDPAASPPALAPELVPDPGTPLYVHLPFCVAKCTYCDFFSVTDEGQDFEGTLDALLLEAERRAPSAPATVFLGGGTPSIFSVEQLTRLLDGLERASGFRASASEVTLECNPESLDLAKAEALRSLGVDRLSIGFQSLRRATLELFGRVHDAEQSLRAYAAAREAGFERVSVDLIYGVPGQDLDEWLADLERVLALEPDHVSAYHLAFEPGTLFTHWLEEGRLTRLSEERELAFLSATRARLIEGGYDAYEISNFCLNSGQCRHNVNYWRNGTYVGLGPAAVSKIDHTRFGNPRSVGAWRAAVEAGRCAASWEETLAPLERLGETWWLGLRMRAGIEPARARLTAGYAAAHDPAEELARELAAEGWLEPTGNAWRASAKGLPLADRLALRFLEACSG